MPRLRTSLTIARSSKALWATTNRSAGPPTRIVVNRASGSSREVLTPIRRWISVPRAIGSNDRGRARAGRAGHAPASPGPSEPVAQRSTARPAGAATVARSRRGPARAAPGGTRTRSATASAAPGRPSVAGRGRHPGVDRRVVEDRGGVEERVRVEVLVGDEPCRPRSRRYAGRSPADDPRRGDRAPRPSACPSAVASARVELPARPTMRSAATSAAAHLLAQERDTGDTGRAGRPAAARGRRAPPRSPPRRSRGRRGPARRAARARRRPRALNRRTAWEPPKTSSSRPPGRDAEALPGGDRVERPEVADRGPGHDSSGPGRPPGPDPVSANETATGRPAGPSAGRSGRG